MDIEDRVKALEAKVRELEIGLGLAAATIEVMRNTIRMTLPERDNDNRAVVVEAVKGLIMPAIRAMVPVLTEASREHVKTAPLVDVLGDFVDLMAEQQPAANFDGIRSTVTSAREHNLTWDDVGGPL